MTAAEVVAGPSFLLADIHPTDVGPPHVSHIGLGRPLEGATLEITPATICPMNLTQMTGASVAVSGRTQATDPDLEIGIKLQ